jgi:Tol biopolymer transport system component
MWRVVTVITAPVLVIGVAAYLSTRGDSHVSVEPGVILYSIGVSTDPYGHSAPGGFGVATGLRIGEDDRVEVRAPGLASFGGADWIGNGRILVPRRAPPFRRPLIYRWNGDRLLRVGLSPAPPLDTSQSWSPDGTFVASEPIEPCKRGQQLARCYRQSGRVYLQRRDGSGRRLFISGAHLRSWTPDGRLLVAGARYPWTYRAVGPRTGRSELPLRSRAVGRRLGVDVSSVGLPKWSADGRYVAAFLGAQWPKSARVFGAVVIAFADGRVIRAITSPYSISMFAWAPAGHRFAYTTSGSPDPHELWVADAPVADPRRIFMTRARHFDWITWSPDGRRLLVDDQLVGRWLLIDAEGDGQPQALPRRGGRPLWCCPVNAYATLNS